MVSQVRTGRTDRQVQMENLLMKYILKIFLKELLHYLNNSGYSHYMARMVKMVLHHILIQQLNIG